MNNLVKNILLFSFISIVFSSIGMMIYHVYFNPFEKLYQDELNKAYSVAEREVQFSDRYLSAYRSSSPTDFVSAAMSSRKAVVFIKSDGISNNKPNQGNFNAMSSGSGVIISNDGYIATNYHVVSHTNNIEVMLNDNRVFTAKLVGNDPNTDLALLKIDAQNLDYLIFGNSDSLQIGEWVMAVGNPFKLQSTVTAGIVSAKGRNINLLENQGIESYIQTDAAVNPGNSGGALVNTRGDLIGICAAILSNTGKYEGFSFAIPANLAKKVLNDLKEFGAVQRGWFGTEIENVDNGLAIKLGLTEVAGVFISSVIKDGCAAEAGLKTSDVIISVNNVKTSNTSEFMEQIGRFRPGQTLSIIYIRDKTKNIARATLKNQINTTDLVAVRNDEVLKTLGVELRDLDSYEKTVVSKQGIMVVSVKNGSVVGNTKLEPGYIITRINNNEVTSVSSLIGFLESYKGKTIIFEGFYQKYPGEYPYTFDLPKQ